MAGADEVLQKLLDKMAYLLDGEWHLGWMPADAVVQLADAYATLAEASEAGGPDDADFDDLVDLDEMDEIDDFGDED